MAFTEDFLKRIEFAGERVSFQKAHYLKIIETLVAPLLYARQEVARKIQSGNVMPEDEAEYIRKYEHVNNEIIKLLGL